MNFIIYLLSEGLSKVIPFIAILIVAKYIDVESFGQLTLYYIILEILTIVIANNIRATARIDFFQSSKERYIETKSTHLTGSFIIFTTVLIIGAFTNFLEFKYLFLLSITGFMRAFSHFILSDLQCRKNAKLYGIYNIIPLFLSSGLFLIAILSGYSIYSWFYTIFIGTFIQFIFVLGYIITNKLLNIENIFNYKDIFSEFKHGIIFMPQAIGFWVNSAVDRVLISSILGNLIVGHYMFAFQLSTPIIIFSTVVNLYLTPKLNRLLKENKIDKIKKILLYFSILTLVFTIVNFIAIEIVINYFYYEKYASSLEYVPFVVVAIFFQALYLIYMNIFYYIGQKKFISLLVLFLAFLKIVGVYIGLNIFDMYGLLYANILINILIFIFIFTKMNTSLKNYIGEIK
jgi:O-antigen/teichoic acid export membrane protein